MRLVVLKVLCELYVFTGRRRAEEEAYFQEVHLQRSGPGPAPGHVLVSNRTWTYSVTFREGKIKGFSLLLCLCLLY